jgi:hypothetical protein
MPIITSEKAVVSATSCTNIVDSKWRVIVAAKRQWLLRVPEIRQDVAALDVPVVDRILFQRLFHVGWRRAIDLMHTFGAYQAGQSLLIDRTVLLKQLEALEAGTEFAIEQGRKQRLLDSLEKVRKHRAAAAVRIPVEEPMVERAVTNLPAGICLQAGSLHVDFGTAEDLLSKLYEFSRAVGNDFEAFQALIDHRV